MLNKNDQDNGKIFNENSGQTNFHLTVLNIYKRVIPDWENLFKNQYINIDGPNDIITDYMFKKLRKEDRIFYDILREIDMAIKRGELTFDEALYILFKLKPEKLEKVIRNIYGSNYIPLKRINAIQRDKEIQELHNKNVSAKDIAKIYNMTQRRVYQIIKKNSKFNN